MSEKRDRPLTDQLRQYVADSGETLSALALATGIDVSALSRFVHGERGVSMEALDALGKHFGLQLVARRPVRRKRG